MSFGPSPWRQAHWDARAAGNFICGGAGAGSIVFAGLSGADDATLTSLILTGLALVAVGLTCVWLEIGRPLRAVNVFINPRTSWMSREAFTATLLFPAGLATVAGAPGWRWAAAALALAFVYCQGRMLQAAKGIPAWREPLITPLIVASGLAEGAGLFFFTSPLHGVGTRLSLAIFAALVLGRAVLWLVYRGRLSGVAAPEARAALDRTGRVLSVVGTLIPLGLLAVIAVATVQQAIGLFAAIAGLAAALAGAHLKYTILIRAAFNQGFALAQLPVRGRQP
ncbi:MAG TPA: phenylacetyl-CoA:acceptor oxidoreductase [Casimicrobiaceae bacterium]|nr:phenylacetyl-CoA:acceptor oxidoreductase [Casimicrobiaceae bacterium]